jgi:hypothetical protein
MRTLLLLPLALLALAACGGADEVEPQPQPAVPPTSAGLGAGPGISIEEALAAGSGETLLVSGNLLADGEEVRLCSALAESFPPQCGGPQMRVEGLTLAEVDGLMTEGAVSWTDRPIQLLGEVEGDSLIVSTTAVG